MIDEEVTIRSVREVGPETVAIDVESPSDFSPHPGQFVKLTAFVAGEHVTRFYTISSPQATDTFELTVELEPDGTLGPWMANGAGKSVRVEGPYGSAYYAGEARSLVLAGGPGIGAAVGIGEAAEADGNEVHIVYRGDVVSHVDRLDALEAAGVTVSQTDDLHDALKSAPLADVQIFVYGFQEFVTDALGALESFSVDADSAKIENYG